MDSSLSTPIKVVSWIFQLAAAALLFQTLFFKFTGAEESIYIFETVSEYLFGNKGMEAWLRYGSGIAELVAVILLLVPSKAWMGALIGIGVIAGAIFFHLTVLGIEVQDDGGTLFYFAITVFVSCLIVLFIRGRRAMA